MALYTQDSIERVKDAVDMVEVVGARTELRRSGTSWTGLCPFHDERTPSFSVNAEKKVYYCFGCQASGDAIRFVQETQALDFKGAVEFLAERFNVELKRENEDPQAEARRKRRERLLRLVERTTDYYVRFLWESSEAAAARSYLEGRGLAEETLRGFRVGYSPRSPDKVVLAAQRDGFSRQEIAAAGLGQAGRDGFHDRFRGRIMFPLADAQGRVLGFGARALREGQRPKYLNTSENELYHKGRQLFGIDRARGAAARAGRIVVVEGYTDVLALHQAGIEETVAIMGTALPEGQIAELSRAAPRVHLALDPDSAGQAATLRAARAAEERSIELRVVVLPEGRDPADLLGSEGREGFAERLNRSLSVPEYQVRSALADTDTSTPGGRDEALARIGPLVSATPYKSATREALVRYVANTLDVPVDYVIAQLTSPTRTDANLGSRQGPRLPEVEADVRVERKFLSMCVAEPSLGPEYLARIGDEQLSSPGLRRVRDWLRERFEDPLDGLPADDPSFSALVTQVVMGANEEPSSRDVLELSYLRLDIRRLERAIQHSEPSAQPPLAQEREQVRARIEELMGEAV